MRHRMIERREVGRTVAAGIAALLYDVILVGLAAFTAGGQDDALGDLIPAYVFAHAAFDPRPPLLGHDRRHLGAAQVAGVSPGKVAQSNGPPGYVGWPL